MNRPNQAKVSRKIDLKLGIKSSFPTGKPVLALIYIAWKLENKNAELSYTEMDGNSLKFKNSIKESIKEYFKDEIAESKIVDEDFEKNLDENLLVTSQIEPLIVALELVWKISLVKFVEEGLPYSAERTAGIRKPKKLLMTKNIDSIDLLYSNNESDYKRIFYNWIFGKSLSINTRFESALIKAFTLMSEETIYKIKIDEDQNIFFYHSGIYTKLIELDNDVVDFTDVGENKGPVRVLQTILKENLNYYLERQGNKYVRVKDQNLIEDLTEYTKRVNNYLSLTYIDLNIFESGHMELTELEEEMSEAVVEEQVIIGKPHNRILFGAPGTGKSYLLNEDRLKFGNNYERVTFHPTYSYAQFVGTYKPKPIYKDHLVSPSYSVMSYKRSNIEHITEKNEEHKNLYPLINEPFITYEFVPGPFLRLLIKALEQPHINYLLIIEEINRANVAAVFGDIFQLLDRDESGNSEYTIMISEEMKAYIYQQIGISLNEISIPHNFYIWSTMNTADQGVYPIDSAFKRRWSFQYISLDAGEEDISHIEVNIKCIKQPSINWNMFRRLLNSKLASLGYKEDKLIGPYFIKPHDLITDEKFQYVFKNKLLMYLFEDVVRHDRNKFFIEGIKTFSDLIYHYDNGKVFNFSFEQIDEVQKNVSKELSIEE